MKYEILIPQDSDSTVELLKSLKITLEIRDKFYALKNCYENSAYYKLGTSTIDYNRHIEYCTKFGNEILVRIREIELNKPHKGDNPLPN